MNLLADESCAGPVIRALREAGHDVIAIAEVAKGSTDEHVLELALNEKRVLITEDRDFGELVSARGRPSAGVILVRFHGRSHHAKRATVVEAVAKLSSRVRDAFTVVEPGRVRISGRPQGGSTLHAPRRRN
jgi:predicted nuclease of predicted toxin-antitoxin system